MKKIGARSLVWLTGLISLVAAAAAPHGADWPDWAYGLLEPLSASSRVAPPCPGNSLPYDCAYQDPAVAEDGIKRYLPDTGRTFTRNEAYFDYGPADWYPQDHPSMPEIVAHGKPDMRLRACALCHYPNGQGRSENGHLAGLPESYILQQLQAFAEGARRSADIRKANTNEMAMIASRLSEAEKKQVAAYYASIPFKKMVRVVETTQAPQLRTTSNGLMLPIEELPQVPLGKRIVVVPEYPERTLMNRDPRGQWLAYVPPGSVAAGEKLANLANGKTMQCNLCHGAALRGLSDIPGIAGRTPSFIMRQLWDFKQGSRRSVVMQPVVDKLSAEDMLNLSAYIASLQP